VSDDRRWALTEGLFTGPAHGEVAEAADAFSIQRVDDGTVLEVDLGDPRWSTSSR
jgi:hypothetical protein